LLAFWLRGVETPLALPQEEVEVGCRDPVEAAPMPLGLVPEIFDAVDVIFLVREELGVADAVVLEAGHVEHAIGAHRVGAVGGIGHDLDVDDGLQGRFFCVRDGLSVDLATAF
jgi:hypothetical protein